jgi:hypothetical protein
MKIKITEISPEEWKALGIRDMLAPVRIGEASVRITRAYVDRDMRQSIDPACGPTGIEYGDSVIAMEVELVPGWRAYDHATGQDLGPVEGPLEMEDAAARWPGVVVVFRQAAP